MFNNDFMNVLKIGNYNILLEKFSSYCMYYKWSCFYSIFGIMRNIFFRKMDSYIIII